MSFFLRRSTIASSISIFNSLRSKSDKYLTNYFLIPQYPTLFEPNNPQRAHFHQRMYEAQAVIDAPRWRGQRGSIPRYVNAASAAWDALFDGAVDASKSASESASDLPILTALHYVMRDIVIDRADDPDLFDEAVHYAFVLTQSEVLTSRFRVALEEFSQIST